MTTRCYSTPRILQEGILSLNSPTEASSISQRRLNQASSLDYNQLKIPVLALLKESKELSSDDVRTLLRESKIELTDKAVKMALMRYTRQGILVRSKKAGSFHYRLTEKGVARLAWLTRP